MKFSFKIVLSFCDLHLIYIDISETCKNALGHVTPCYKKKQD